MKMNWDEFWKKLKRLGPIFAFLVALIGLATACVQLRTSEIELQRDLKQSKEETAEAQAAYTALQKTCMNYERGSLVRFDTLYKAHVTDLKNAVSRYRELEERPENSENAGRLQKARQDIFDSAAALAETATKWRKANNRQKGLIDGPITGMQTASEAGDVDGVIRSLAVVEKTENDLMPMLESSIDNLPVPEGDTTCE